MKTHSFVLLLMASLAFVLLGCSDNPNSLVVPGEQALSLSSSTGLAKMGEDLHFAVGTAHWKTISYQSRVRFNFSAIQHKDGSVSGELHNNDEGPNFRMHGVVSGLMVEGNKAKICFTFSKGSFYVPPGGTPIDISGWLGCVVVVDNGEGRSATGADLASLVEGLPAGAEYSPGMTVEDVYALGIDEYLDFILAYYQMDYNTFVPAMEYGSVQIR